MLALNRGDFHDGEFFASGVVHCPRVPVESTRPFAILLSEFATAIRILIVGEKLEPLLGGGIVLSGSAPGAGPNGF